jgi:TolA-binding protein
MSPRRIRVAGALLFAVTLTTPAFAVDKEHRQLMADVRILQEQNQQLQNLLASIADAIKAVNARLDEQANASRKALADQKLVIDNLTSDVRVIREKLDDNNVRLGSLTQEVEALRQGVQQLGTRSSPNDVATGGSTLPGAGTPPPGGATPPFAPGTSPDKLFETAQSDYFLAQWDLAIAGFDAFIRAFPKGDRADEAQVNIGNCYLQAGKNDKAVEAYDVAIRTYPGGNALPEAFYKKGLALKNLKQLDRARDAFDTVVKNYPNSAEASLARQQLTQAGR